MAQEALNQCGRVAGGMKLPVFELQGVVGCGVVWCGVV